MHSEISTIVAAINLDAAFRTKGLCTWQFGVFDIVISIRLQYSKALGCVSVCAHIICYLTI